MSSSPSRQTAPSSAGEAGSGKGGGGSSSSSSLSPPTHALRIEDVGAGGADSVVAELRWGKGRSLTGDGAAFPAPLSPEEAARIDRYLEDFRPWGDLGADEAGRIERTLIEVGQAFGAGLTSRPNSLRDFFKHVREVGIGELEVSVASNRPSFFGHLWESLVLPGHPHLVSASAAALVRTLPGTSSLHVEPRGLGLGPDEPLRVLRVVSRAGDEAWGGARNSALTPAWDVLRWKGAIDLDLRVGAGLGDLLGAKAHVVHLDAAVRMVRGGAAVELGGSPVGAEAFAALAARLGASLVVLDPAPAAGLRVAGAELALALLRAGVPNVIVDTCPRRGGGSERPIDDLLGFLVGGWSLRRAVVEVRKRMQQRFVEGAERPRTPASLQRWVGLHHYSSGDVRFVDAPVGSADPGEVAAELRRRAFGFPAGGTASGLPVRTRQANPLRLLAQLEAGPVLVGRRGLGSTTALHQLAAATIALDRFAAAFYWDFRREAYAVGDMVQMMAGALGHADPAAVGRAELFASGGRFLLALDNVEGVDEPLRELLAEARATGHGVVLTARAPLEGHPAIEALPLSDDEARDLVVESAPDAVKLGAELTALVDACRGVPFLVRQAALAVGTSAGSPLLERLRADARLAATAADPVAAWTRARWEQVPAEARRLLEVVAETAPLSLGLLMVGLERSTGERTPAGEELWAALELPRELTFRQAVTAWQAAGFLSGHQLDRGVLTAVERPPVDAGRLMVLARAVTTGMAELARRAVESPDHPVYGNILANRADLARWFERVWFSEQRSLAARAIARLQAMMRQAGLAADFDGWGRTLLERTELVVDRGAFDATLSWLTVANLVRDDGAAAPISEGVAASAYALWARLRAPEPDDDQAAVLFAPAATFLQRVFDARGDVDSLRALASLAMERIPGPASRARWGLVAVAVELERGDPAGSEAAEAALLGSDLTDDIRTRVLLDLAWIHLRRGDLEGCEARLIRAREAGAATGQLEAEVLLARGNEVGAAARFCALWRAALSGQQGISIDDVVRRMDQLRESLGEETFAAIYAEHAAGQPTPAELGVNLGPLLARGEAPASTRPRTSPG